MGVIDQLNTLLAGNVYALLMVFARVGTALMLIPGLGDNYTPARSRLLLSLGLSLAVVPAIRPYLPPEPADVPALFVMIFWEFVVGAFLGTIAQIFMTTMETAGQFMAQQIGLSNAYIFNPQAQTQGSIPGTLLTMTAMMSMFVTDLYQVLIKAIVGSYEVFHYNSFSMFPDMSEAIVHLVSRTFLIAVEMCGPFFAIGLLMYSAFGLIGRLLPQIQVFFVTLPLQLGLGLMIFALSSTVIMHFWVESFAETLKTLGMGG